MLKNYRETPRDDNWQNIEAKLRYEKMNMKLKSKFEKFAVVPHPEIWEGIESKLNEPIYQNKANYGLRIAACICFILLAVNFNGDKKEKSFADVFRGLALNDIVDFDLCHHPQLIELDIVKIKPVIKKPRKRKNRATTTKTKSLLDVILAVDEDIAATVDSALIADLIKPTEVLSEEGMYATTGKLNLFNRDRSKYRKMYYLPEIKYNLKIQTESIDSIFNKIIKR